MKKITPKKTTRMRGIRFPTDLDDYVVAEKISPAETFSAIVIRMLYERKANQEKAKKK